MEKFTKIHFDNAVKPIGYNYHGDIDIRKMVYEASSKGGFIYVHPLLFSEVYRKFSDMLDRPYEIDPHGIGLKKGKIQIVISDLINENECLVMTAEEYLRRYPTITECNIEAKFST